MFDDLMDFVGEYVLPIGIIFLLLILVLAPIGIYQAGVSDRKCLEAGFPERDREFCIRYVNGSPEIVRLEELTRGENK